MEGVNQTKKPISHPFLFIQHFNLKDKSGSNSYKISEILPVASTTVLIYFKTISSLCSLFSFLKINKQISWQCLDPLF